MGTSGSKPDWYPGEPEHFNAPQQCSCNQRPHSSGGAHAAKTPASGGDTDTAAAIVGRSAITSLPVVTLTDMEFIDTGAFCAVYACKYRGWSVVAKRVRQDLPLSERRAALANLWTEYDCLRSLSHPNIVDVYGMCRVRCREDYDDWNERDVCLLLEKLAFGTVGHLFETIVPVDKNLKTTMARARKMKMVPFRCRLQRTLELAQALEYVHGGSGIGPIMHRDIKSVNVGFAQNGRLKLMDFGLSKMAPPGCEDDDTYKMTGEVGSYRYMAPELVKHEPYNVKVDIYSWAILSWEILAIEKPYSDMSESTFIKRVVKGGDRPEVRRSWPNRLCTLLASAWHADHAKRPVAADIVTALGIIYAELSTKERRKRPSYESTSLLSGRRGSLQRRDKNNRRHSWSQLSSRTPASAFSGTRLPSRSNETGNGRSSATRDDSSRLFAPSSSRPSPGRVSSLDRSSSLPLPLRPTSSPTHLSLAKRRWLSIRRKSRGPDLFEGVASAPLNGEARGSASGGKGGRGSSVEVATERDSSEGTRCSRPAPESLLVASVLKSKESDETDSEGQGRAPVWTASAVGVADDTSTCGGGVGGRCGGYRCQQHQAIISKREIIADALRRETAGLVSSGAADAPSWSQQVCQSRTTEVTIAPKAEVGAEARRDSQRRSGDGGGGGGDHERDPAAAANRAKTAHDVGGQWVPEEERVRSASDVSRRVRRNSSVSKLWPTSASTNGGGTKGAELVAAAVASE
ncbi:unnamed protein product [Ectocarpus sp. 12 AP-2014]